MGDHNKHQGIIRNYNENIQVNLEEMNKFLDANDHPKLNQGDIT
jgi:hypothetical protein